VTALVVDMFELCINPRMNIAPGEVIQEPHSGVESRSG
jgi:hypothetical protein